MHMNGWNRALTTLLAAGVAGFLLWLAAQFDMRTTGGYWAALGVVAGCGVLLGLGHLRGRDGNPPAMLLLAFLPVFVCASWILLYAQPHSEWGRHLIRRWSDGIGIGGVTHDVALWNGVVAFGLGLVFSYVLEPATFGRRRRVVTADEATASDRPVVVDRAAADEPLAAERDEVAATTDTRRIERTETTVR
jgi:hypothetical protein